MSLSVQMRRSSRQHREARWQLADAWEAIGVPVTETGLNDRIDELK